MGALTRNCVIDIIDNVDGLSGLYRILHICQSRDAVVLFALPDSEHPTTSRPAIIKFTTLTREDESIRIKLSKLDLPAYMKKTPAELTPAAREKQKRNWSIIEPLLASADDLFFGKRGAMIKLRSRELGITEKAVHRVLLRYWQYGQTKAALIPASERSGGKGNTRIPGVTKRGRPRKAVALLNMADQNGVNVTENDRRIFQRAIDLYHVKKSLSITKTYQRMRERFYNDGYAEKEGTRVPILKPTLTIPSIGAFRSWFGKLTDDVAIKRARTRGRDWDMNLRGLVGSAQQDLFGPCERFEIDATIADVFLVSRYNKKYIVGRPTIYVVIDVFSRMIVGMYIGWKHPSWDGARLALLNAFSDKVQYCARFGVRITFAEWPCMHLPQKILADKGEIAGEAPLGIANNLDIQIESTATGRGDLKGVVESRFSIFNASTIHDLLGATTEEKRQRGEPDPRLSSALDIEEFTVIMIKAVMNHNRFSEKPHLLSKEMIADDVVPTPIHIWNWGLVNATGSVQTFDREEARIHLMRSGTATVYEDGIHFHQMRYVTERAVRENWFSRARMKRTWTIDVRYTNDTNELWHFDAQSGSMESCVLIAADERFKDMRLEEAVNLLEYQKVEREGRLDTAAANLARNHANDDATLREAKKSSRAARKGMSQTAQTADMRENRHVEQAIECAKERQELKMAEAEPDAEAKAKATPQRDAKALEDLVKRNQGRMINKLRGAP